VVLPIMKVQSCCNDYEKRKKKMKDQRKYKLMIVMFIRTGDRIKPSEGSLPL
jgi:hypothetical protein